MSNAPAFIKKEIEAQNVSASSSVHSMFMEAAFQNVLEAEFTLSSLKNEKQKVISAMDFNIAEAEYDLRESMKAIDAIMKESGEFEVGLTIGHNHYKINYSTPRQSVKIVDIDAVPDEFCKIERKPKLKEIGELLKNGNTNWAMFELGEKKLQWKAIKHIKEIENE